jgi:hypothetical protein
MANETRTPRLTVNNWTKDRYNDQQAKAEGYVWLQGVGYCKAKPLQDFQVGEHMGWNYGSTSVVVDLIRNQRGAVVGVVERSDKGQEYRRTRRGTTLTAWAR